MKFAAVILTVVSLCSVAYGQGQPANLPGYSISIAGGYSYTGGNSTNNGFWASAAVPILQLSGKVEQKYGMNIALRGDYFTLTTPQDYVVTAGPEFRLQYSKPTLLSNTPFQPFVNTGLGAARAQCVSSATCPSGADQKEHFVWKVGVGLDIPVSATIVMRPIEFDYLRSSAFPNGYQIITNAYSISAGFGVRF